MPVLEIHSSELINRELQLQLLSDVAEAMGIDSRSVWVHSHCHSSDTLLTGEKPRPIVYFNCRESHQKFKVELGIHKTREILASALKVDFKDVFVIYRPVIDCNVYSPFQANDLINLRSIGKIKNNRIEVTDDSWGNVESVIEINPLIFSSNATRGLSDFSHVEVIFYMDRVEDSKVITDARHPRNNKLLPEVGILAQRAKNRINKIAVTRCKILSVENYTIKVIGLDAVNDSPVLDIKPVILEFESKGKVIQPEWASDIMSNYF
jgi:hypothetical protein